MSFNPSQIHAVRKLLRHEAKSRVIKLVEKLHPVDLAELLSTLAHGEARFLVQCLFEARRAGATFRELPDELLASILGMLDDAMLAEMIGRQPTDDAVFFLTALPELRRGLIRQLLPPEQRTTLDELAGYPEGTASTVMTTSVLALREDATVADAIEEIRRRGQELEAIYYLYVVDDQRRLTGVIPLRMLITSEDDVPLKDLMFDQPIYATLSDNQKTVADLVAKYNFLSLPVTDGAGKLVGVVTVDDVIDVIYDEASQDFFAMAGLPEEDAIFSPVATSVRKRLGWTAINLVTAVTASAVIGFFEPAIEKVVALATFMPIVAGLGGNSGTQSLTVMIRGLSRGELEFGSSWKAIARQLLIGFSVGALAGLVSAGVVFFWRGNPWLGGLLFLAMVLNMAMGALVGAAIPLLLRALHLDPALGAGILVTGVTDSFGFLAFLGLATALMAHLG